MKKYLLLFLIFLTLNSKGQTSVYHEFPDSNAVWNIGYSVDCFWAIFTTYYEEYSIIMTGDTIINSNTYHKLYTPSVFKSNPTTVCGGNYAGLKGLIREDILLKKVFIALNDSLEELLYDFNMEVGDTVKGFTQMSGMNCPDTVISIDSVLVGSNYHKRWLINDDYNIYFIEGIGSTYGLLEQSIGNCVGHFPYRGISCFSQNGTTLYPSTTTNCEIITSINSNNENYNEVKIYPNPSNGSFTIDLNTSDIKEIRITDLLGKVVLQKSADNETTIKIDNLAGGVYLLTLTNKNNRRINRKIISSP